MKAAIAALALSLWGVPAPAADDEAQVGVTTPKPQASVVRQETLELPGLTACHQCEWRPKPHTKAAPEECGTTPDGTARLGNFECGFSPDCERVCSFVDCKE
jgi:hypothetical protein